MILNMLSIPTRLVQGVVQVTKKSAVSCRRYITIIRTNILFYLFCFNSSTHIFKYIVLYINELRAV